MKHYFIAAVGTWNKDIYLKEKSKFKGNWIFISDEKSLLKKLKTISPDFIFFLHWRFKVPQKIISSYRCICFHMTDLPYGRGGSPLQNLIIRNKLSTKISAIVMTNKIDAGPILLKKELKLNGSAEEIYIRASNVMWKMIKFIVSSKKLSEKKQAGKITYFKRRKPKQSQLPKNLNEKEIYNFIRMLDAPGYPKAFIQYGKKVIILENASFKKNKLQFTAKIN